MAAALVAVSVTAAAAAEPAGAAAPAGTAAATPEGAAGAAPPEHAAALTLERALALAYERSPEIAAAARRLEAADGERRQAGLLPNPTAEAVVEDVAGSGRFRGGREAETTLRLGQRLELGGKRRARTELAARAREAARRELEIRRGDVRAEVAERLFQVLAGQHELGLRREASATAERVLRIVRRRVDAGKASELEERKARVALARSLIAREHAEHQLAAARRRLAASWGDTVLGFPRVEGSLFARRVLPPFDDVARRVPESPEMARRALELARRGAEIAVADAAGVPDLTVTGGVRRFEADDAGAFVLGLSLPLPLFDRNQGAAAAARARLGEAEEERRAAEARLRAQLFAIYQELRHAETELERLEREIVPAARDALEIARAGFEAGRFSLLDLLDAQRTFLEVREEYIRAATTYQTHLVDLERLIGGTP